MLKDYGGTSPSPTRFDSCFFLLAVLSVVHDGRRFPHDAGGGSGRCADFTWDEERLLGSRHWPTGAAFLVIGNTVLVLINARVFPVFDFLLWRTFSDDDRERVQTSGRLEAEGLVGSRFASLVFEDLESSSLVDVAVLSFDVTVEFFLFDTEIAIASLVTERVGAIVVHLVDLLYLKVAG
uniref:Uncharacterized protein n=1 Tax=Daphnia magna TaxID=35525 RepID=A0A0N8CBI1_9CRUS